VRSITTARAAGARLAALAAAGTAADFIPDAAVLYLQDDDLDVETAA
jgi:hypothetical protein